MNDFYRVLQILKERKTEKFAMATVIDVEGSAYRHKGAKMLIDEKGITYGMISGGCLEEDLIHHAMEVLQSRKTKIVTYNLKSENEISWGEGIGCNGVIYVLIETIGWNMLKDTNGIDLWEKVNQKLLLGYRVASLTAIDEHNNADFRIYYGEDEEVLYCSGDVEQSLINDLRNFIYHEEGTSLIKGENQRQTLMELYKPRELLYIFGAGPDIEPLVELVAKLDFSVCLIDPRSQRCNTKNFPNADQHIIEFPHVYLQQHNLPVNSFVLIMTHNFQWDQSILNHLIHHPTQYVGVLGPKKRTERLLNPKPVPEWIDSPVGVEIYAEGQEEIAISICAQLIKRRNRNKRKNTKLPDGLLRK